MSKQSEAKAAQGYILKSNTCAGCAFFSSERVLPAWMVTANDGFTRYTLEIHGVEKNFLCNVGGFAVKKTASCNIFKPKDAS